MWKMKAGVACLVLSLTVLMAPMVMAAPGDILYVQDATTPLRVGPAADAAVVARLSRGHKLKEFRRRGPWVKVISYTAIGREGWVGAASVGPRHPDRKETPAKARPVRKKPVAKPPVPYVLSIDGHGLGFQGRCKAIPKSGEARNRWRAEWDDYCRKFPKSCPKLSGSAPISFILHADAVSCRVRKDGRLGRLTVTLRRGNRIILTASSTGLYDWIRIRGTGPWGRARALRCDSGRTICVEVRR